MKYGLLCLSNNTAIASCFKMLSDRFRLLYKHKAYIHNYYDYMTDKTDFDKAIENVEGLIYEYENTINKKISTINKGTKPFV